MIINNDNDSEIEIKRKRRAFMIMDACNSISTEDVESLISELKERKELKDKVKPPFPILNYIKTEKDINGVPISGEGRSVKLSYSDIDRLNFIVRFRKESGNKLFGDGIKDDTKRE